MSEAREIAWLDGTIVRREEAAPSVASSHLHLGTSVFEGIMAYWDEGRYNVHLSLRHMERFVAGTAKMRLPIRHSAEELVAGVDQLLETLPDDNHYIRPIALRRGPELYDVSNLGKMAEVIILAVSASRDISEPMRCCFSPWRRISSEALPVAWKVSGTYANSMLAQYDAYERGYDTAILLDKDGFVSEACTANVLFVEGDKLVTPHLSADVFPGITRDLLIAQASERGVEIVQRPIRPEELSSFDAAFICATLLEVRPVATIDAVSYSSQDHPMFADVLRDFRRFTHHPDSGVYTETGFRWQERQTSA